MSIVLPGLRLDYLVSLEVNLCVAIDMDVWTMIGELPRLAHLTLHQYADNAFKILELACPEMHDDTGEQSDAVASEDTNLHTVLEIARPTFLALTTLVLRKWNPQQPLPKRKKILRLVKRRAGANMPIKALRFEICADLVEEKFLSDLRQIVDQVIVVEQDPKS
ncbi:hypothetical protein H0H92_013681 [Tricholoma furcatifolium]|nr:hypothetical protein H0H92_013681 [Tricholoma furcatifolium]